MFDFSENDTTWEKIKKTAFQGMKLFLVFGAVTTLGLLSFGGMYALTPTLWPAIVALILAVIYEREIYSTNIISAFKKFFNDDYLKEQVAKQFLLKTMLEYDAKNKPTFPSYFHTYYELLTLLDKEKNKDRKKILKQLIADHEQLFTKKLFAKEPDQELNDWLNQNDRKKACKENLLNLHNKHVAIIVFALISAGFMTIGTSFLLVDSFAVIFTSIGIISTAVTAPYIIIPLALIAGIAWGVLTYNTLTNLIQNKTIDKWATKFSRLFTEAFEWKHLIDPLLFTLMLALSTIISVSIAATFFSTGIEVTPLFTWLQGAPQYIMSLATAVVVSFSELLFAMENMNHTVKGLKSAFNEISKLSARLKEYFAEQLGTNLENEHWSQKINPARFIVVLTFGLAEFGLFIGHLISIGVAGDKVPGIPPLATTIPGVIGEALVDADYIFKLDHQHKHGVRALIKERLGPEHTHSHEHGWPTLVLHAVYSPLYAVAIAWDFIAMHASKLILGSESTHKIWSFENICRKQVGLKLKPEPGDELAPAEVINTSDIETIIPFEWKKAYVSAQIKTQLQEASLNPKQVKALKNLNRTAVAAEKEEELKQSLSEAKTTTALRKHGFFEADTRRFIEQLERHPCLNWN